MSRERRGPPGPQIQTHAEGAEEPYVVPAKLRALLAARERALAVAEWLGAKWGAS